jgi:hypothetical protein
MLEVRIPISPTSIRTYPLESVSETRVRASTALAVKFWHAMAGLYLSVYSLVSHSRSLKFYLQLAAGSSSLILDTSGKSSEGISHTGGQYGFVTFPFASHCPAKGRGLICLFERFTPLHACPLWWPSLFLLYAWTSRLYRAVRSCSAPRLICALSLHY